MPESEALEKIQRRVRAEQKTAIATPSQPPHPHHQQQQQQQRQRHHQRHRRDGFPVNREKSGHLSSTTTTSSLCVRAENLHMQNFPIFADGSACWTDTTHMHHSVSFDRPVRSGYSEGHSPEQCERQQQTNNILEPHISSTTLALRKTVNFSIGLARSEYVREIESYV